MSEYKGTGADHTIVHSWADNKTLNRLRIRLDDASCWQFGFTSSEDWNNGDTVQISATSHGYEISNARTSVTARVKFCGYAEA